ncbi:MAG: hypothetical protein ACFE96_17405 [Candidatus Hermodarchaeota archaeon]
MERCICSIISACASGSSNKQSRWQGWERLCIWLVIESPIEYHVLVKITGKKRGRKESPYVHMLNPTSELKAWRCPTNADSSPS